MAKVQLTRDVEVRHEVDLLVAGGGPSGIAAAITAARQGRRVLVVEAQSCLGGLGTAGGLFLFCAFTDGKNFVDGGVCREVHDRLRDADGFAPPRWEKFMGYGDVVYRGEVLKRLYDDLLVENDVEFVLCTQCIGVETKDGRIETVFCWAKSGLFAIKASVVLDCTGDGDLCTWAGVPFEKGDPQGRMQAGTLLSLWADIDWDAAEAAGFGPWSQGGHVAQAIRDSVLTTADRELVGMLPVGRHAGGGNIGHLFGVDGTDEHSVTAALLRGRKMLQEYERYYKEYLKGYEAMELVGTAAMLGIRETRRILGDYVLNLEDYRRRAVFEDEIGRYSFKLDVHASEPDQEFPDRMQYRPGESYGIPYRCLTPRGLSNVLVAGRCISTDRHVNGSVRVMPGCFITGQAAGMAAAMAVERRAATREIPVHELQTRLKKMGAFLPNH